MTINTITKLTMITTVLTILLSGCGSNKQSSLNTASATNFATSCDTLMIQETKNVKFKLINEKNDLIEKNRIKSIQIVYFMKHARNECKTLTGNDVNGVNDDNIVISSIDEIKSATKNINN